MLCYVPGTGTLAGIGLAAYLIWHKAIGHFLGAVGMVLEFALIIGGAAAAVAVLTWTARTIQQRRGRAGACTTCRFRCQQSIRPRPHLLVNRVDRRLTPVPGGASVAYDGYVLTPDGVNSRPAQAQASASTRVNASM
jgi:hypothetical protein